jgi:hypothetical protein
MGCTLDVSQLILSILDTYRGLQQTLLSLGYATD